MSLTPEITFRNMEASPAIRERVEDRVAWLERHNGRLTHVRVTIEAPHRNHQKGKIYHVKIAMGLPGHPELVVSQEPENNHAHEDVYVAIRDAFAAARRLIEDRSEIRAGRVKTHEA